jgi:hypothetical protein
MMNDRSNQETTPIAIDKIAFSTVVFYSAS